MTTTPESDLLFPDKTITIGGEDVIVHEFTYLEGLSAAAIAQPLLTDLMAMINQCDTLGTPEIDRVIGNNAAIWLQLLAMSIGKPLEWAEKLSDADGTLLSMTFWEMNGPFLLRRVVVAKQFGHIMLKPPVVS